MGNAFDRLADKYAEEHLLWRNLRTENRRRPSVRRLIARVLRWLAVVIDKP